ncbi:LysR family transcriptional regulator [Enterocloster citroniae]|uniref:LysR family transcriptional regulator n=1 Tax=Enterocloster citroniae TaxID=358743 RepID=UPI001D09315C|nr:LysR family transcriptional regulator [Enterocloster citroniae]MCB7062275.1 LysR family transcriptional regulator [Enterocloster citroniae]
MNLKQMEYFITIVNEGSISAAAKSLHISQPPLSTQMKLLEEELGVTLFQRGSRSIILTEAGKLFYDRAQGILDMTGAARQELEQMGRGLHGALRLGMISSVETEAIINRITAFRTQHPGVNFCIYEGNTYQLMDKLNTGLIEAAIVRTPFPEESYDCLYLAEEPMMAVGMAKHFPDPHADSISLGQLAACPLIIYRRWENVLNHMLPHNRQDYLCVNDDARTSLSWADTGIGIAITPASIARCTRPGMLLKSITTPGFSSHITLIRRKHGTMSAICRDFITYFSGGWDSYRPLETVPSSNS